ncbi:MAG: protein kinase, partial [Planctomycetota bacterium]|nr:protein kinase [Planctomycetota bacterium]
MPIELFCSNFECRTKLKVRENQAGKKIRCPKCKTVSTAPIDTRDSAMGSGTGYEATMVQEVSDSVSGESEQIDATADRFEQAWQDSSETGEQPRIEDYLSGLNGKTHSRLLKELLYLEIELRLRKGERVDPEDYSDRFPDWTSDLAAAIESIQVSLQSIRENPGLRTGESVPASTTAIAPNDTGSSMNLRRLSDVLTQTSPAHQRYRSRHEIAKGGMGVVNLCIDESINRPVAMKVMRERLSNSKEGRVRFLEEAQITGQLEHPNIVPIHELGQDAEGNLYFTMKLVKGKSLGEILKEMKAVESGPALQSGSELSHILAGHSLTELLKVFLKVCDGIAFAHSKGVIHRDLKPDNIMVGDFGEVLVMDWGLAKVLGPDRISQTPSRRLEEIKESEVSDEEAGRLADTVSASGIGNPASLPQTDTASIEYRVSSIRSDSDIARTMGGAVQGTPQYMPPEQAEGDIEKIDHRSDLYSLGAILYELLTLKRSVQGKTVHEVLLKVTEGKILAPHKRAPERHIPKELSAICVKAMQKHRHRRYQSAKEVASDINLYLEGRAVSAKEDTFWETLVKLFKRNRGVSIAVGAASIIFSIGLVLAFTKITKEKNQAVWQKERAQKAREEQYQTALSYSKKSAEQAVRAAEQSRWDEAITRVEAARGVLSDGPWGFYAEGMLLWHKKEFLEAEEHLENAVKRLRIIEGTLPEDLKKVTTVLASIKTS